MHVKAVLTKSASSSLAMHAAAACITLKAVSLLDDSRQQQPCDQQHLLDATLSCVLNTDVQDVQPSDVDTDSPAEERTRMLQASPCDTRSCPVMACVWHSNLCQQSKQDKESP